jgi:hypothetical protein
MRKRSAEPGEDVKRIPSVMGIFAALGIGSAAQYAFDRDALILGVIGYGLAIWIFVSQLGRDLEHDSLEENQDLDLDLLKDEIRGMVDAFASIRKNWRQMTIAEILLGSYDKEAKS